MPPRLELASNAVESHFTLSVLLAENMARVRDC